jgi:3,4-dihydroxy 2-butanone 4-phosphate synthase
MGFLLDHKSLKIGALDVERSFTCHRLVELCRRVVNLKNEIDKEEEAKMFGEEFHTPGHIFFCIEHAHGLQMRNGHIELSVALTKLVGIIPILVCQKKFY